MSDSFKTEMNNHSKNTEHGTLAQGWHLPENTLCEGTLLYCGQLNLEDAVTAAKLVLVWFNSVSPRVSHFKGKRAI